ncbi:hypothetical protein Nos7524_4966 [Nostoc sp. PCC 7524]|uniref:hypothetical protein n=1 Tax=Nostoc sp. (strain ATCC 29411 / PCC 7524) TaxID=28072 RepID=UPI00029F31B6|nr:hypothetical protein [Nostoc sp. PCC 7524]AFY50692.1 hypothetical protein Nos7524_4966 [Nostoc sp. PCC 7524]
METKTITIRVNAEAARIFEAASEEQRRKFEALLGSWQLLVILVGGRQRAEGRRQKLERYN